MLTSLAGFAPPLLLALGERLATHVPQHNVNTVTTNVPGPQQPLYAAGRRMLEAFGYVPLGGHSRVGVAIFSYNGHLGFGVTGDYDSRTRHRRALGRHRSCARGAARRVWVTQTRARGAGRTGSGGRRR